MRYTVIWENAARAGLERLRKKDGDKIKPLLAAINALAGNPEPENSTKLGGTDIHRLRVGQYRATYEINGNQVAIRVLMVGSTPA